MVTPTPTWRSRYRALRAPSRATTGQPFRRRGWRRRRHQSRDHRGEHRRCRSRDDHRRHRVSPSPPAKPTHPPTHPATSCARSTNAPEAMTSCYEPPQARCRRNRRGRVDPSTQSLGRGRGPERPAPGHLRARRWALPHRDRCQRLDDLDPRHRHGRRRSRQLRRRAARQVPLGTVGSPCNASPSGSYHDRLGLPLHQRRRALPALLHYARGIPAPRARFSRNRFSGRFRRYKSDPTS